MEAKKSHTLSTSGRLGTLVWEPSLRIRLLMQIPVQSEGLSIWECRGQKNISVPIPTIFPLSSVLSRLKAAPLHWVRGEWGRHRDLLSKLIY